MVQLALTLKVTPSRASDAVRVLRGVMSGAQWGSGWICAQVYRNLGDPDVLQYVEEWLTADDAAREVRSARFSQLLELMEAAAEQPLLEFRFVSEVRGLDFVAEARGDQHPSVA